MGVINWWRRKPSAPACGLLPPKLRKRIKEVDVGMKEKSEASSSQPLKVTCPPPSKVLEGGRFSSFALYNVALPVPSFHEPGSVIALDWKRTAELAAVQKDEL